VNFLQMAVMLTFIAKQSPAKK